MTFVALWALTFGRSWHLVLRPLIPLCFTLTPSPSLIYMSSNCLMFEFQFRLTIFYKIGSLLVLLFIRRTKINQWLDQNLFLEGLWWIIEALKPIERNVSWTNFMGYDLWLGKGKEDERHKIGVACSSSIERKREGLEVFDKLYTLHGDSCGYSIGSVLK